MCKAARFKCPCAGGVEYYCDALEDNPSQFQVSNCCTINGGEILKGCPGIWPGMRERIATADFTGEYLGTLRIYAEGMEAPA